MVDNNVWTEKYAPKEINEMILHSAVRNKLENALNNPQHLILYGSTGVGKGTFTNIFLAKTGADELWVNASDDTGIDNVREKVKSFATAASIKTWFDTESSTNNQHRENKYKYLKVVVFNEAENLSSEAQASLRELMERVENRCKFIFMTNNLNKIDQAIKSRCLTVEITQPPISDILKYMEKILDEEGIVYEKGAIATFVQNCYPDIRKTINEIKGNCNDNYLERGEIIPREQIINKVLIDLKLYMAINNIDRRKIYNKIKDRLEIQVEERQFYYLIRDANTRKVSKRKKSALINCIQEIIPIHNWQADYERKVQN